MPALPGTPRTDASRRRALLTCVAGSAALLAVAAGGFAQPRQRRVGFLSASSPDEGGRRYLSDPFVQGLRELGHVEGPALAIHFRWAAGQQDRLPALLTELLALNLDVLVAAGPRAAKLAQQGAAVPVVAVAVDDPVQMGLATSFARPGGHVTGISSFGVELVAKRLQLMKDLVPAIRRVGILVNPFSASPAGVERSARGFAQDLGVTLQVVEAPTPDQFEAAFAALVAGRAEGLLVLADATFYKHRALIGALCQRHRLPSVWGGSGYLDAGGLASYQSDFPALFRRAATLVDQILKGAKPAEMPFEQATKLELVINLKAARAMGITVPPALLAAADEVLR